MHCLTGELEVRKYLMNSLSYASCSDYAAPYYREENLWQKINKLLHITNMIRKQVFSFFSTVVDGYLPKIRVTMGRVMLVEMRILEFCSTDHFTCY